MISAVNVVRKWYGGLGSVYREMIRGGLGMGLLAVLPFLISIPVFGVSLSHWISLRMLVLTLLFAFAAQAWNIMSGYTGLFSFGHAIFFGTGAYATQVLVSTQAINPWIGMLVGAFISLGIGLLIGWLTFRYEVKGHYFALVTFAFAELARNLVNNMPEKVERAEKMGLDRGVVAEGPDEWVDPVREVLPPRGADVILDLVGGDYLEGNVAVLAEEGRQMVVGVPGGVRGTLHLRGLMGSRASIRGTVLRARPSHEKVALAREFEDRIMPLFERGALRAVVDRVFEPEEAGAAHRYMQENRTFGKILLKWTDE